MSEEYTKLAKDIVYSSVWEEDGDTCKVWITLLALKDKEGMVGANVTGISRLTKLSVKKCQSAIQKFLSPDPSSNTDQFEGRRLEKTDKGWRVLNHQKYHEYGWSEDKKKFERERKAKWRSNGKVESVESSDASLPTLEEVNTEASLRGVLAGSAKGFFDYHTDNNLWLNRHGKLINWRTKLVTWGFKDREKNQGKDALWDKELK